MSVHLPMRFASGSVDLCALDMNNYTYVGSSPITSRFMQGLDFSSDGKHLIYSIGIDNLVRTWHTAGVAWDIAPFFSGSAGTVRPGTRGVPAVQWAPDGLGFYCIIDPGLSTQTLQHWTLDTPYTMGHLVAPFPTLVATRSMGDTPAGNSGISNFRIKFDGTKMLCMINTSTIDMAQYNFGTPWDITTMTYVGRVTPIGNGSGFFIADSGNCMYSTWSGNYISHWPIDVPWTASLTDASAPSQLFYTNTNPPTVPDACPPNRTECRIDVIWLNNDHLYIGVQPPSVNGTIIHQFSR